jgi:hypothetical protein
MPISNQALPRFSSPLFWAVLMFAMLFSLSQASAQFLFDSLLGGSRTQPVSAAPSAPSLSFTDLSGPSSITAPPGLESGHVVSYCVRLCDGRFFPIQHHAGVTPVQTCNALCPAAKTKIFTGSDIANASASNGERYTRLTNAFLYRKQIVPTCTCNGKDAFGLVTLDVAEDPTLRAGDLVATEDGLQKFTGSHAQLRKSNGSTPVNLSDAAIQRRKVATTGAATAN